MTPEEIRALDPFEAYPHKYDRKEVHMLASRGKDESGNQVWEPLSGQAYIQVNPKEYVEPVISYKVACCKTIYLHRKMLDGDRASSEVKLDIYNGVIKAKQSMYIYSLSDHDLANL